MRVADGDQKAFSDLYHLYSGRVFSFIQLYLKDEMIAEDLVQTIFIRCWERRKELASLNSLKDFLFIITRNQVFDHLRRIAVQAKRLEDIRLQSWYLGPGENAPLEEKDLRALYMRAITELPPQQQEVYRRYAEQEESLDDIAREMNISRATAKKHLELARKSVRMYVSRHSPAILAALLFVTADHSFFS